MELNIDWSQVLATATSAVAIVGALAWLAKRLIDGFFSNSMAIRLKEAEGAIQQRYDKELETFKNNQKAVLDKELEALRGEQQILLADIKSKADQRLEHLKGALTRVERLEGDLIKSRGKSYGEIWTLTGALNLYGPIAAINLSELSDKLKNWYFEHGWVLSDESVPHYFLVQEVLNFAMLKSISFVRPDDNALFNDMELRPIEVLRGLRKQLLNIEPRGHKGRYKLEEVKEVVSRWKAEPGATQGHSADEKAWVLFQFVLSTFRTRITKELGSRQALQTAVGGAMSPEP